MDVKPPTGTPRRPWIRAYTAPNRLLVSENGWPFRRFGGGAGSGGGAPRPSRARLCAPTNAPPEPSRPTHPNSATPGRLRPSASSTGGAATTENGREAAERDRKSAAASGGSPQAPAGTLHTQIWARPTHPRPCWSCAAGPARLRPTGTQSDACGRAGGRWVGGRLGSRSRGQPGRVCRRPAVARGRGQARAGERAAAGWRAARRAPAAPPGRPRARGSCRCRWAPAGAGRGVGWGIGGGRPSRLGRRGRSKPRATYALGP